ncbi:20322_t:CDS:1, partial [Rhizophagus irregularis]
CENTSTKPEGCRFYWKAKKRISHSDCGKPTASACGQYPLHIRG